MTNYKTFKQLVTALADIKTKEELHHFCYEIDMSYQHDKITYNDNEVLYKIINNVVRRDLIG